MYDTSHSTVAKFTLVGNIMIVFSVSPVYSGTHLDSYLGP